TVVVVTDRRLLDKQLRENIKEFPQVKNIVAPAYSSMEFKNRLCLKQHIEAHPDFQSKVAENPDVQNRDIAFNKLLEEVMHKQRKQELDLDRLYANDDSFKRAFFGTMKRLVDATDFGIIVEVNGKYIHF